MLQTRPTRNCTPQNTELYDAQGIFYCLNQDTISQSCTNLWCARVTLHWCLYRYLCDLPGLFSKIYELIIVNRKFEHSELQTAPVVSFLYRYSQTIYHLKAENLVFSIIYNM